MVERQEVVVMEPATNPFNLAGRRALVTGSSRGIGRAVAFALGRAGAEVFFHGAADSPALEESLAAARAEGIAARKTVGDLRDSQAVSRIAAEAAGADILVLNASVQSYGRIEDFDDGEFERMVMTNLRSSFRLVRLLGPAMAGRGWGRIVSIGSVNQGRPAPRLAIYAATKAAQKNLMLTAAKEWAASGVTVNTVTPGVIATDRNAKVLSDPAFADPLRESIPAKRFGTAEDCAGIVLALCSDACSYVTGADVVVDGGMSL
ncbi:MAG: SDR family oxidoreductase [Kiritimatiellae bacterium]|nr:SDR family oxidoreductase [Kiritimatiellia bacterium]